MPGTSPGMTIWVDQAPGCLTRHSANRHPAKRKRPWGAGVFTVNLGVVGVLNIHVATLGGCKEPREFVNSCWRKSSLANDRVARTRDHHRLAGFHHARACGLG